MRSGIDAQVSFMTDLTRRSYDALRKLSELNVQYAQQLMQDSLAATRQMLACTDPLSMASTLAQAAQPAAQHLHSYQQQLFGMLTGAQVALVQNAEALLPPGARYSAALAKAMADEALLAGDPRPHPSRANGAAADSTGTVHQAH
ncbi:MAG: phasin family protein [Telluria sp.]